MIKSMLKVLSKINQSSRQSIYKLIQGSNVTTIIEVGEFMDLHSRTETKYNKLLQIDIHTKLLIK
jgi:hypothetical protein